MTTELTKAAQAALNACERIVDQEDSPVQFGIDFRALGSSLRRALTQRPAAQSEAQALAHNMMLWREDAVHNGNEYVPVHVRTLEKVIAQLRDMPAPQQATPEPVGETWGWAIEDKHGAAQAIRPARKEFFGCVQSSEPFTAEDVSKMDCEWAGLAPHRIVTLFTRPAPGVPEADPLQGAVDWFWQAIPNLKAHDVANRLSIGCNRAARLLSAAQAKGAGHA